MSDAPKPPAEAPQEGSPPPIRPNNVLDTVFRDDGPLPPARLGIRALAFLLDFILISGVATVLIWKVALPQSHPGAFSEFLGWGQQIVDWADSGAQTSQPIPQPSRNLAEALDFASDIQLLVFWLYFALGEAFFAGSVGKCACRLRTVSTITLGPPNLVTGLIRGGMKTAALFFLPPLALTATLIALFFNRRRQMGHDLLSRTVVVDEKRLPQAETQHARR